MSGKPTVTVAVDPDGRGYAPKPYDPLQIRPPTTAAEIAARALARCTHHKRQGFGREVLACLTCELIELHGRQGFIDGRALPHRADPMCRMLVEIMADGGPRTLAVPDDDTSLLAEVNRRRTDAGQSLYSAAALSARLRELPGYGYDYDKLRRGRLTMYQLRIPAPETAPEPTGPDGPGA